ncbi:hypothetical protein NL108_018628, partial [Boleophthalmus pectinirostris]
HFVCVAVSSVFLYQSLNLLDQFIHLYLFMTLIPVVKDMVSVPTVRDKLLTQSVTFFVNKIFNGCVVLLQHISMGEKNYCIFLCVFSKTFLDQVQGLIFLWGEPVDSQHQQKDMWPWGQKTDAFHHFLIDVVIGHAHIKQTRGV